MKTVAPRVDSGMLTPPNGIPETRPSWGSAFSFFPPCSLPCSRTNLNLFPSPGGEVSSLVSVHSVAISGLTCQLKQGETTACAAGVHGLMGMVLLAAPTSFLFVDKHPPSGPTSYPVVRYYLHARILLEALSLFSFLSRDKLGSTVCSSSWARASLVELCLGQSVLVGLDLR